MTRDAVTGREYVFTYEAQTAYLQEAWETSRRATTRLAAQHAMRNDAMRICNSLADLAM